MGFLLYTLSNTTLYRGSKLDDVSAISQNLASESKRYKWGAKQMSILVRILLYLQSLKISVSSLICAINCVFIFVDRHGGSIGHP